MSYDIRFCVRTTEPNLDGDRFVIVHTPEYYSPTYNYSKMFRACMGWDYETYWRDDDGIARRKYYHMPDVLPKLRRGLAELENRPEFYRQFEPENKWGTVEGAIKCIRSWILELTPPDEWGEDEYVCDSVLRDWPLEALWWRW
jgi:hypothetical protein